jgi:hypothetical protein
MRMADEQFDFKCIRVSLIEGNIFFVFGTEEKPRYVAVNIGTQKTDFLKKLIGKEKGGDEE